MERINLADSGVETSRVALGTWAIGGRMWGGTDEAESIAAIQSAVERGVTLIDTAPAYGAGRSEEIIGKALKGGLRAKAEIATKGGLTFVDGKIRRDSSPKRIREEVEESLKRLQTDVIDLYQIHWPDHAVPFAETARALEELRKEGKIRAIGVSNYSVDQMDEFRTAAELDTVQPPYNLFEREIEADILPYARHDRLTILCYGALCRGMLAGRISAETKFSGDDLRQNDPKFQQPRFGNYLAAVAELKTLARDRFYKSLPALAVRWVLDQGRTIALWGARRPDQLDPMDEVDGWRIDAKAMLEIDEILKRHVPEPIAPTFMAPPANRPAA
jgi:aryl-alcohol dehydrogenase-like predicted oxidoreductase